MIPVQNGLGTVGHALGQGKGPCSLTRNTAFLSLVVLGLTFFTPLFRDVFSFLYFLFSLCVAPLLKFLTFLIFLSGV